jgi:tryptophan synthase alpha chain
MSRIESCFADLRREGRKALIPFVTAGDPNPRITVPLMHVLAAAGADIIELGVPFSDPMADGPVIQRAGERALAHHVNLRRVLELVADFRRGDTATPVVLMGYLNPIEAMGYAEFARAARRAGVDGVVTVDMPPEEAAELAPALLAEGIDPVFLVAPTTTPERIRQIAANGRGFIYYVSLKGVTGASNLDVPAVKEAVARLRAASPLPIGVGFGIKDAQSAMRVAAVADAVIVGSALVRLIEERVLAADQELIAAVAEQVRGMRRAIDGGVGAGN